jgi:hypothetical protein
LLQQQGHQLGFPVPGELATAPRLNPPFRQRQLADEGIEIANGDGTASVRVDGARNAAWLVDALNTAAKYGHFGPVHTTMITAVVPPLVALLAVPLLGEPLGGAALGGLACVTAGLLVGLRPSRTVPPAFKPS